MGGNFCLEVLAVNTFATAPSAGWVAALNHKVFNNAMKNKIVVVTALPQSNKVFHRCRGIIWKKIEGNVAFSSRKDNFTSTHRIVRSSDRTGRGTGSAGGRGSGG